MDVKDTLPTLVSVKDTKPNGIQDDKFLPVVLTKALREKIKDRNIIFRRNESSRDIYPNDDDSDYILETLKVVYIRNALEERNDFKYNKCLTYGMYLNSYYRTMQGMNVYDNIYKTLLTNDKELFKLLEIGKGFKEIEIARNKLILESETIYSCTFNGKNIVGNSTGNLTTPPGVQDYIKLTVKRVNSNKVKITALSTHGGVRAMGLNKICRDLFGNDANGGHRGICTMAFSNMEVNNFYKDIINGYSVKFHNFENIRKTYHAMDVEVTGNMLRKDDVILRAFKMVSACLFAVLHKGTQVNAEKMING